MADQAMVVVDGAGVINEADLAEILEAVEAIRVEKGFAISMEVIAMRWCVGQAICTHPSYERLTGGGPGRASIIQEIGKRLPWGRTETYACARFYELYPDLGLDLSLDGLLQLPGGKNLSWNKIKLQLLPDRPRSQDRPRARREEARKYILARIGKVLTQDDYLHICALMGMRVKRKGRRDAPLEA